MTDTATPALAGAEALPMADANSIDGIIDNAATEATKEVPPAETPEPKEPEDQKPEETFPKKAVNAISRRDKQIGKLRAEREQLAAELEKLRVQATPKRPQAKNDGAPKEADFTNYAEYLEAKNAHLIEQKLSERFTERDGKHQETQRSQQEQAWVSEREGNVAKQAQDFIKENPDAIALVEEYSDVVDEFSPQIQRLFLEADNAPLAFYNLAKEGKLESLGTMSLAKAAMEIGRAQMQAPAKPKTKAPTPLPASRGSVPGGKSLDSMSGDELYAWVKS